MALAAAAVAVALIGAAAWLYFGGGMAPSRDGTYMGEVCYGPSPADPARCYAASATLLDGKLTGQWPGRPPIIAMHLEGEVSGAGAVKLVLHGETEGPLRPYATLNGTLQDGRLNAAGAFLNGRTVVINWQRK